MGLVKQLAKRALPLLDILVFPLLALAIPILKFIRRYGMRRMRLARTLFDRWGFLPVTSHYYDPYVPPSQIVPLLQKGRKPLAGLSFDDRAQRELLEHFRFADELKAIPMEGKDRTAPYYRNGSFEEGDAEILYSMMRHFKPRRVVEVGSGYSTLFIQAAIKKNREEDGGYVCQHLCVEPYENPWLEKLDVRLIRRKVEETENSLFATLGENDLLFIDSTHMIRAGGDVLHEYLHILPLLQKGVIVHVHDIFTPRDYPAEWLAGEGYLWNEQYLLEAFLSFNESFKVMLAVNDMKHRHYDAVAATCPNLAPHHEPASFYFRKVR